MQRNKHDVLITSDSLLWKSSKRYTPCDVRRTVDKPLPPFGGISPFVNHLRYNLENTSNTPDSISFAELQQLAAKAPEEQTPKSDGPFSGMTEKELVQFAQETIDSYEEVCGHPMLAKVIILNLVNRLMDWHTSASFQMIEDEEERAAIGWARDAGKFQAIGNILHSIQISDDDFLV